jgi:hypothetical protein
MEGGEEEKEGKIDVVGAAAVSDFHSSNVVCVFLQSFSV